MRKVVLEVSNVSFSYNCAVEKNILHRISFKSWTSEILTIVGPSGSGKTTLIKLIISLLPLRNGSIKLFGLAKDNKLTAIPGYNLGYMPQDDCLPKDLLVKECLYFFAILNQMTKGIGKRVKNLLDDLELDPFSHKFVSSLSGGTKRRLSLAIALLHKPKLLILDEPTVGSDPVLRCKIWKLLQSIKNQDQSIIITTHYIEECKYADNIVFLRNGQVAWDGPGLLILKQLEAKTLDEAFIKLCNQNGFHSNCSSSSSMCVVNDNSSYSSISSKYDSILVNMFILIALLYRYFHAYLINPVALIIFLFNPILTMVLLHFTSSDALRDIPVGIVIEKQALFVNDFTLSSLNITPKCIDCVNPNNFKNFIDLKAINLIEYEHMDDAVEDIKQAKIYAAIRFNDQFVDSLFYRLATDLATFEDYRITNTRPTFLGDLTNKEVFNVIHGHLTNSFMDYWKACQENLGLKTISLYPIKSEDSLLGHFKMKDQSSADVLMVGQMLNSFFSACLYLASVSLLAELRDHSLERYKSIGLSVNTIIIAQVIANVTLSGIAAIVSLSTTSYLLKYPVVGSYWNAIVIILLQVFVGVLMGQFFAAIFRNEIFLLSLFLSLSYIAFAAEGSVISLKSQPYYIESWTKLLPNTMSLEALRAILFKGHDLFSPIVMQGLLSNIAYITIFGALIPFIINKSYF